MPGCIHCEGFGCTRCLTADQVRERQGGEQGLRAEELELLRLRQEVEASWLVLGLAWRRDGVSLAQAIRAKLEMLEGLL